MPRFLPRRPFHRRYCSDKYVFLLFPAAQDAWHKARLSHTLPLLVRPEYRLPALMWLPGHIPAQLQAWSASGNCFMSTPSSATIVAPTTRLTPGIVSSNSTCLICPVAIRCALMQPPFQTRAISRRLMSHFHSFDPARMRLMPCAYEQILDAYRASCTA